MSKWCFTYKHLSWRPTTHTHLGLERPEGTGKPSPLKQRPKVRTGKRKRKMFLKGNGYSPSEKCPAPPGNRRGSLGWQSLQHRYQEKKNIYSPQGWGPRVLPSWEGNGLVIASDVKAAAWPSCQRRQKGQDRSCHSGARLKLPHRRKTDPALEQGLKSKDSLAQCNYEGIRSSTAR